MHLSDETSQKIIHSCRVTQLIIPFLAISSVVFLGIVFSDFVDNFEIKIIIGYYC